MCRSKPILQGNNNNCESSRLLVTNHNSSCILEEVTREFLSGSRGNAWENMAENALRKEWKVFRFERLNKHQKEALRLVVESKSDVFVNLPTGFGKSVVFQVLSMIVYSYVEPTKVEPKKPDALLGSLCTAALFLA